MPSQDERLFMAINQNPAILVSWLHSESSLVRIRGARRLAKEKPPECLDEIRIAIQKESVLG